MTESSSDPFRELVRIVARLRDPQGGCPWDLKQTHETLKPYLIEEAYEVIDAIDRKPDTLAEELGDLLLQVVLHAQIAAEDRRFTIDSVAEAIAKKLVRRHPHVFGDTTVGGVDDVLKNWEQIKKDEKKDGGSVMEGIPRALPALIRAQRAGDKAARLGVDPQLPATEPSAEDLLCTFLTNADSATAGHALKLLLWRIAQLARERNIDSEMLLQSMTTTFTDEFVKLESAGESSPKLSSGAAKQLWTAILRQRS